MEPLELVPVIYDPITYLNVAKASFRIYDVKVLFVNVLESFHNSKMFFENKNKENNQNSNILYELLGCVETI